MKLSFEHIKGKITRRHIGIVLAIAAALLIFVRVTVVIREQKPKRLLPERMPQIITRYPLDCSDAVYGYELKTAIRLSWYSDTLKLIGNAPTPMRLNAALYPVTVKERELVFSSSDTNVAEIDGEGNILAKKPGSVELTVRNYYTGNEAKAFLHVIRPVTGFYLEKSTINLFTTDMGMRLGTVILPDDASNSAVKWYSKDPAIVEVDQTGHLKPNGTGMTEIVATTSDGGFSSKCFVNVINQIIKAEAVKILNKFDTELNIGDTWTGIASVQPSNAKNTSVEWVSSNPNAATVTKNGVVRAVAAGNAIITAKSADGPMDSVEIKVSGSASSAELDMNPTYSVEGGVNYTAYNITLDQMAELNMAVSPTYNDGYGQKLADKERVKMYLDPNEFSSGAYKYQFMDLSKPSGISREALAAFLDGKGILSGKADTFLAAARMYSVNELYLVAHCCVETGYGSSTLANGVIVNGQRVYNMFGIGAYDSNAVATGAQRAYKMGWTSPEAAIIGGAKFISEYYVNSAENRQNTIYKMRWNPDAPATHQYAGDVSWATMQAVILQRLFAQLPEAVITYEVPVYAGSNAAEIR